jgi:hypothetical protein
MAMTTDRDDASVRRYRVASEVLDERPSAAARAAILAAAARHVEATPRAADAPRAVHRRRWPLAAAAAVLLSTLAVMMAQRTEQEMPTFTAPAERSPDQVAMTPMQPAPVSGPTASEAQQALPPAPPASPVRTPQPIQTNEARADDLAGAVEPGARLKKAAPAAPPEARRDASPATREREVASPAIAADTAPPMAQAAREAEAASAEARSVLPAPPAAAPPAIARAAPAESAAAGLGAASRASDSAKSNAAPASRAARMEAVPAPALQGAIRQDLARNFERTAQEWLEHIVKLRGEGRHAEADAELQRFRVRYPDVQVPANALAPGPPAAGTR